MLVRLVCTERGVGDQLQVTEHRVRSGFLVSLILPSRPRLLPHLGELLGGFAVHRTHDLVTGGVVRGEDHVVERRPGNVGETKRVCEL